MNPRTDETNEAIRNRAYEIWDAEGRPEGREHEHWLQACRELDISPGAIDDDVAPVSNPDLPGSPGSATNGFDDAAASDSSRKPRVATARD